MIVRREKMRKELHRSSVDVFLKQNEILLDEKEDFSGDNLDFIRHRTARFSRFSEFYMTEKDYEHETGEKVRFFDDTIDESLDLFNSSAIERVNPDDFKRESNTMERSSKKHHFKGGKCTSTRKPISDSICSPSKRTDNNNVEIGIGISNDIKIETDMKTAFDICKEVEREVSMIDTGLNIELKIDEKPNVIIDSQSVHTELDPNLESKTKVNGSERNIFELLVPKSEVACSVKTCDDTVPSTSDTLKKQAYKAVTSDAESAMMSECIASTNHIASNEKTFHINDTSGQKKETLNSSILSETESAFNTFSEFLDNQNVENMFPPPDEKKPDSTESVSEFDKTDQISNSAPIPNNCGITQSSLFKRKKKRFRNLFPCEGKSRRNSPRLHQSKSESEDNVVNSAPVSPSRDSIQDCLTHFIHETKRRRLNSSGDDYPSDIKNKSPDFVRITRSRGTCSHVTGTA